MPSLISSGTGVERGKELDRWFTHLLPSLNLQVKSGLLSWILPRFENSTSALRAYMFSFGFYKFDFENWMDMLGRTSQWQECKAISSSCLCVTDFRILICLIIYLLKNNKTYPRIVFLDKYRIRISISTRYWYVYLYPCYIAISYTWQNNCGSQIQQDNIITHCRIMNFIDK
jgi:hypothetical protein